MLIGHNSVPPNFKPLILRYQNTSVTYVNQETARQCNEVNVIIGRSSVSLNQRSCRCLVLGAPLHDVRLHCDARIFNGSPLKYKHDAVSWFLPTSGNLLHDSHALYAPLLRDCRFPLIINIIIHIIIVKGYCSVILTPLKLFVLL
jgi:hypothetical protein